MPVPWLVVGNLVLGNLDKIMAVVRPGFTRRKIDAVDTQTDLLNQQIAELQAAAAANAEQIRALAAQLKDVVSGARAGGRGGRGGTCRRPGGSPGRRWGSAASALVLAGAGAGALSAAQP